MGDTFYILSETTLERGLFFRQDEKSPPKKKGKSKQFSLRDERIKIASEVYNWDPKYSDIADFVVKDKHFDLELFGQALEKIEEYEKNPIPPDKDRIPALRIEGQMENKEPFTFYKMPTGDWRTLFVECLMTPSCYSCTALGIPSDFLCGDRGLYVVENGNGKYIGYVRAIRAEDGELVLLDFNCKNYILTPKPWRWIINQMTKSLKGTNISALYISNHAFGPQLQLDKVMEFTQNPASATNYDGQKVSQQQYRFDILIKSE